MCKFCHTNVHNFLEIIQIKRDYTRLAKIWKPEFTFANEDFQIERNAVESV